MPRSSSFRCLRRCWLRRPRWSARDLARAVLCDHPTGDGQIGRGDVIESFHSGAGPAQCVAQFLRHGVKLDSAVEILGVLAYDPKVDSLAMIARIPGERMRMNELRVELELLAHAHDRAAIREALGAQSRIELFLGFRIGERGNGPEKRGVRAAQNLKCARRKRIAFSLPKLPPDLGFDVFGIESGRVENRTRRGHDFGTDAVAGQPGNDGTATFATRHGLIERPSSCRCFECPGLPHSKCTRRARDPRLLRS